MWHDMCMEIFGHQIRLDLLDGHSHVSGVSVMTFFTSGQDDPFGYNPVTCECWESLDG